MSRCIVCLEKYIVTQWTDFPFRSPCQTKVLLTPLPSRQSCDYIFWKSLMLRFDYAISQIQNPGSPVSNACPKTGCPYLAITFNTSLNGQYKNTMPHYCGPCLEVSSICRSFVRTRTCICIVFFMVPFAINCVRICCCYLTCFLWRTSLRP